jgi:hypothetical protein
MASLPQNPAQLPSDGTALFATSSVDGDCQNMSWMAATSCRFAKSMSWPNRDLIVPSVEALSGSLDAAGAALQVAAKSPDSAKAKSIFFMLNIVGCTARIEASLIAACEQSKTARTTSGKELVIIKDQAVKDFMKANDIHLRCDGGSRAAFSDGGRAAGDSAGYGATFGRPVSGAGAIPRLGKT